MPLIIIIVLILFLFNHLEQKKRKIITFLVKKQTFFHSFKSITLLKRDKLSQNLCIPVRGKFNYKKQNRFKNQILSGLMANVLWYLKFVLSGIDFKLLGVFV
jgi:hypothetical protein